MKKYIALAALGAAIATPAYAAPGDTATAEGAATATVVAPITLTHDDGAVLAFGTFTAGDGGVIRVTRAGNGIVDSGNVELLSDSVESADSFTVGGDADRAFTVTTTDGQVQETGGATMDFTTNAAGTGTLDATGAATFAVGGSLTVGAAQTPGDYTGTYDATVTYN